MKQSLILCPRCEKQGKRSILGEIGTDGSFIILRFGRSKTKIISKEFIVTCGDCEEPVYMRKT